MTYLILGILYLINGTAEKPSEEVPYVPVCSRNIEHLQLSTKIELSMGCSFINNRRAYSEARLVKIFEGE